MAHPRPAASGLSLLAGASKPGEVTPRQCHEIGLELANIVWGGRLQGLVATHMNTDCLHNHFVINTVSYLDGKKYEQKRSQYHDLRRASDAICREKGLSVIEKTGGKTPRPIYEAEKRGEPTRYNAMRQAIRQAVRALPALLLPAGHLSQAADRAGQLAGAAGAVAGH